MKQIPINEASAAQLRYHAETVLGFETISRSANRGQILAKIEAAAPGTTHVTVEGDAESPAQVAGEARTAAADALTNIPPEQKVETVRSKLHGMSQRQAAAHHHDPKIEIFIPSSSEKGGDRDVKVAPNGVQFLVQRDKWVPVPYRVFEALKLAVQTMHEPNNNNLGELEITSRDVYSYPFSTRNEPTDAEVREWRERTANVELA